MNSNMVELRLDWLKFIEQLHIYLRHFPKHEKYALTNDIQKCTYEMFDYFVEIEKKHNKKTSANNLDICYEKLRAKLWLAHQLGYFDFKYGKKNISNDKKFIIINNMLNDVGIKIYKYLDKL